jgi:flagellar hook assembly protein FlgD
LNGEIILDLAESEYIGDAIDIGALESPFIVHNENTNIANFDGITISNYPNPFNPSTTIKFSLPIDENVNLSIYNVKGQKIKTLSNDRFNSGKHSIVWNGRDESNNAVSSGIYFYKLATDNQTIVKKCIMMK